MSNEVNGSELQYPTIQVVFNPQTQQVSLSFNPAEFKDWIFVRGILHAAQVKAEEAQNMAQIAAMQQAQQIAAQNRLLAGRLKLPRG